MSDIRDLSRKVRSGEELATQELEKYLAQHIAEFSAPLTVEQFPSGYSNLTYLLKSGEYEWILRRPPFGSKVKKAHDMGREYRVLSALYGLYPIPSPILHCDDEQVIGAPFYIMQRLNGVILRRDLPAGLDIDKDTARQLSETLIDHLVDLHSIDIAQNDIGQLGHPEGYLERQVTGWIKRYYGSQTDDIAEMETVAKWLPQKMPVSGSATMIHNDYKYDNIVLAADNITRVIGVLDWEMATVGDPLSDLGTVLGYWVNHDDEEELQKIRMVVSHLPGSYTRRQLADRYAQKTGRNINDIAFYYCFALFKIAVIIQQIYYRYVQGHTQDKRFAGLLQHVKVLSRKAAQVTTNGEL